MNDFHPTGFMTEPPVDRNKQKRKFLRSNANFAGFILLLLVASLQLTFPLVLVLLSTCGVVSGDAVYQEYLGLGNTAYLAIYTVVYTVAMGAPLLLLLCRRGFNPFG